MRYLPKEHLPQYRGMRLCAMCLRYDECEPHHVIAKGRGGARTLNIPLNLIAVDRVCHDGIQGREEEGCRLVAMRECLDWPFVRERLWQLIRAPKTCHPCPSCWGAGSTLYECLNRPQVYRRQPCALCAGGGILLPDGRPFVEAPRVFH